MIHLFRGLLVGALVAVVILPLGLLANWSAQRSPMSRPVAVGAGGERPGVAIVRQALRENPEIVLEALQILRQRQQQSSMERGRRVVRAHAPEIFRNPDSPVGGNPNGDVTIVEFFDYRCQYCKRSHRILADLVAEDGRIRFVYKEFPILGAESMEAARAALAARRQGRYVPFHDALMRARGSLHSERIFRIAGNAGLDVERLRVDMASPAIDRAIRENHRLARSLDIRGTPAFVVGERVVPGAIDRGALDQLIRLARNG
ncbi:MAG: DsbA family protein [Alphaproteobacteria bacterium]